MNLLRLIYKGMDEGLQVEKGFTLQEAHWKGYEQHEQ